MPIAVTDAAGAGSHGYDAGKTTNGRKRHIAVDTMGLLLVIMVTSAEVQDRRGCNALLSASAAKQSRGAKRDSTTLLK